MDFAVAMSGERSTSKKTSRTIRRFKLSNTLAFVCRRPQQIALEHVMGRITEPRNDNEEEKPSSS